MARVSIVAASGPVPRERCHALVLTAAHDPRRDALSAESGGREMVAKNGRSLPNLIDPMRGGAWSTRAERRCGTPAIGDQLNRSISRRQCSFVASRS